MTNFEKIKQMNVEEMVEFICCVDIDEYCNTVIFRSPKIITCGDPEDVKEWLESEVQEDE